MSQEVPGAVGRQGYHVNKRPLQRTGKAKRAFLTRRPAVRPTRYTVWSSDTKLGKTRRHWTFSSTSTTSKEFTIVVFLAFPGCFASFNPPCPFRLAASPLSNSPSSRLKVVYDGWHRPPSDTILADLSQHYPESCSLGSCSSRPTFVLRVSRPNVSQGQKGLRRQSATPAEPIVQATFPFEQPECRPKC